MAPDYTKPPLSNFTPRGMVKVSAAALEQARQFAEDISRVKPKDDWVISFEWAESRTIRRRVDGPREELGAGLVLVVYDRSDLPPEAIQTAGDLEFAIRFQARCGEECAPHDRHRRNCIVEGDPTLGKGRARHPAEQR